MDFLDLINVTLLLSQLALTLFLLWNLWGWLVASLDIFLKIFQEKQRETFVFFWPSTKPPWHHKNWYYITGGGASTYMYPNLHCTSFLEPDKLRKGVLEKFTTFSNLIHLCRLRESETLILTFFQDLQVGDVISPFLRKEKLTKMLCGAINNQTNKRWMSSE